MIVAFPFAWGGHEDKDALDSAVLFLREMRRRTKAEVVQMTDKETRELDGVDGIHRCDCSPFGVWYFDAMMSFPADQFLRLDYDCVVIGEVEDVFDHAFDIAIAKEHNGLMNNGVVFVKDKAIFREAKECYLRTEQDNWLHIQTGMQAVIDTGAFRVKKLPVAYNQRFKWDVPVPPGTKILHFKGSRKAVMLDYCYDRWPLGR